MSEKEEEFPFQQLVEALSDSGDLTPALKPILAAVREHNAYWTYSALSTLIEMLRSKEEDPSAKCRCLEAAGLLMATQEYPALTLIEVYLLPLLQEVAMFRSKKSEEQTGVYFQQTCSLPDSQQIRKDSVQFVGRAGQLIFLGAASKPHRTVEVQQLKQPSLFAISAGILTTAGIPSPKWKWVPEETVKRGRKEFLAGLRRFQEDSEGWAEFLLVNLLEEIRSGKKELLELRQLLSYGQNYLTSPVINVCEDELNDLGENFQQKRRYLGLLSELVRCGDIQAIIMIKNSEFLPAIAARAAALPGHLGVNQGEQLFPEIHASKQVKREFYCDFLRAIENWAKAMPSDYDSEDFNIRAIYKLLKEERKFKFPDNLLLGRYEKEAKENLVKNQERNEKLVEILQQTTSRQPSLSAPFSRSNMNPPAPTLSAQALQTKLEQAQNDLKALLVDPQTAQAALQRLTLFKDSWIGYLQALNLQEADEEQLEAVVSAGEKCVEQIQLIVPLGTAFSKGKLTHKEFKQRIAESLEFHLEVSKASNLHPQEKKDKPHSISISALRNSRNSHLGKSQLPGKSKIAGRQLRSRIKEKSKLHPLNPLNLSRAMDRSNISRYTDRSRVDRSKFTEKSKVTERSRVSRMHAEELAEKSKVQSHGGSQIPQGNTVPKTEKSNSIHHQEEDSVKRSGMKAGKSLRSQPQQKQKEKISSNSNAASRVAPLPEIEKQPSRISRLRSKDSSHLQSSIPPPRIDDYGDSMLPLENPKENQRENSSRRSNGSRILLRRSHSKLEHSRQSGRSDKEGSSIIKPPPEVQGRLKSSGQGKTVKISEGGSELREVGRQDETIELNGKSIKEGSISQRKSERSRGNHVDEEESQDHFKDEVLRQISSIIHSSAKAFHNSAQEAFSEVKKDPEPPLHQNNVQQQQSREPSRFQNKNSAVKPSSLAASSKSKQQSLPNPPEPSLSQSHSHSHQQSQQEEDSSNDIIVNPDLLPMRHSFHQNSTVLSPRKLGENPQFKEVFTNKYEGLQARQKEQKLLRNNSGLKNIIKTKQKPNKDSIAYQLTSIDRKLQSERQIQSPRLHMEYGGSYQSTKDIQFQQLQDRKNREIAQLREKIQELQRETMTMRTKLVARDNQLKSIKNGSVAGSERNFQFTSPGDSKYDRVSRSQSRSEKGSIRGSSMGKGGKGKPSTFQKQVQSSFRQYLERIQGTTFRKSLLKQKCLIHKSDELEIGCLSQTGETLLEATLYITPHRFDLVDFTLAVQHDSNLRVRATPQHVKLIGAKRQQKVSLSIEVLKIPFCLPQLQINYKAASQYASNYHRLVLPLAFNKLCSISPLADPPGSHLGYLRTDDFKFNGKVGKLDKLGESFSGWSIIPPGGKERQQWLVMGKCRYGGSRFSLCLNLGEKSSWIEGFLIEGDPTPMRFLICTFKDILDASKK